MRCMHPTQDSEPNHPGLLVQEKKRTGNAYVNRDPLDKSIVPIQRFIIIFYFSVDSKSQ